MKQLIINTGDISDADGFLCIAEYALTTDADILFIMNFPAYLYYDYHSSDSSDSSNIYESFTYGLREYLTVFRDEKTDDFLEMYDELLSEFGINVSDYDNQDNKQKFIMALIKISAFIIKTIFLEAKKSPLISNDKFRNGNIYFMVGGINTYNPFSISYMKNEIGLYINALYSKSKEIKQVFGDNFSHELIEIDNNKILIYGQENYVKQLTDDEEDYDFSLDNYDGIYLDGNGSCSIFYEKGNIFLNELFSINHKSKIRGFFIMGGVINNLPPATTTNSNIHRVPTATMNQLYCAEGFLNVIELCKINNVYLFIVPNNNILIDDNLLDDDHLGYLMESTESSLLKQLCDIYYTTDNYTKRSNPKKPFDVVTAKALVMYLQSGFIQLLPNIYHDYRITKMSQLIPYILKQEKSSLFYNSDFAITILTEGTYYDAYKSKSLVTTSIFRDKEWYKSLSIDLYFTVYECFIIYIDDCDYSSLKYAYKADMPLKIHKYIPASSRGGNRKPLKKVVKKLRAYKKQK